ncbi:ATP-binding cassette domain-containing protein [Seohaeicola zhoushanensis]
MLARVGLADKADQATVALSHGEHRRMEIAIALASEAELMLLDEPMAGLGTQESLEMVALLKGIKGKHSILLIEHDMDAVFALADRISVLVYGHIIATGSPDEIRGNEAVQHAYLGEE